MDTGQAAIEIRTAIKRGDTRKVLALIGTDANLRDLMTPFGTWLHVAATFGNLDLVRALVALGADVNRRGGTFNAAPINRAASEGHIEVVQYLLSVGAQLDVSEPERNPLFAAIYGGHIEIVKLLVSSGIDTRVKYTGNLMSGMNAMAFALERGQSDIAAFLADS